ncbi:MFS transporter [Rhizomonospora bruguierae]|uniref:MFS transporter n=1 Tax=Rhizomonospora bruguierae TaxID=1581705 RepID=UPI001BD17312|nr:MFS transporter [Micromonospora sp. NBRC 107566]
MIATAERARIAVSAAFIANGLGMASWISRIPAVRDALSLTPAQLGLLLLCLSGGAVTALPLSGPVVHRFGPARAVVGGVVLYVIGLVVLAAGVALGLPLPAGAGLLLVGMGTSTWDVAINVEGADVERRLARPLMPRLHAGFSIGTVAGALLGAGAAAIGVPPAAQFLGTAALLLASMLVVVRSFLPLPAREGGERRASGVLRAWREPRTLLIGVLVLAFAFTEGTANDWLTVAFVDGYRSSDTVGALGYGVFVAAMTAARVVGSAAVARYGRVAALRGSAVLAGVGLVLVMLHVGLPLAMAGALLWGAGAALGFPVGMSAGADDPEHAAVNVSVVSSLGYTAFLAGPPLIGFLAGHVGILPSLVVVVAALLLGLLVAGASRPPVPAVSHTAESSGRTESRPRRGHLHRDQPRRKQPDRGLTPPSTP